ncbi:hypothetical protein [Aquimarina amphilecti]|uniref:hypothetical protein n=1 Tax=Aquimarina amphilecti TaxID=1038014 RepID=UPI0011144225|nr:hypothetical protein [Aquimarina amphilecti]
MKKIFLLLIILLISISCNDDDEIIEITNIRVNHYQDTGLVTFFWKSRCYYINPRRRSGRRRRIYKFI